ncbi:MAG: archaetidylserine decarboxylase [Myxococcota bacterium]
MNDDAATESKSSSPPAPLGIAGQALLGGLHLLPKNLVSRWAGRFASLRLPAPIQRAEIQLFARLAGVDLSETRDPLSSFPSLQSFFTRALAEGRRPVEGDEATLVSPCDGAWGAAGRIENGTLLQVKGRAYAVADLLGDRDLAAEYEGGAYATLYLSPRDYHRFHTPIAGRITRVDYWPGALWPVNPVGLKGVDGLFAKNERICAYLEPEPSQGGAAASEGAESPAIALVAVGATMVGSVRLGFSTLTTNQPEGRAARENLGEAAPRFARGEEWGHFEFGSTIVMLLPPGEFALDPEPAGTPLRLGTKIGQRRAV